MDVEPILQQLKQRLQQLYGERLKGLYLFGSHARGEARADSDIDVAAILDDFESVGAEIDRTSEIVADLSLQHDCVVALVHLREADWQQRRSSLLMNLQREGVAV